MTCSKWPNAFLEARPKATPGRFQRGLTLLELLVTLSIAAILVTLGVPGFQDLIRNNRAATQQR
ncbi:prepilin-type N-terminal cleavage/methylation domain-containing protein [Allochromatium palmeri]|uniref:prepilin-type N-terminal cleavage/methylation domain-containing protein n=1 Tax=Allochromatium palmeri TaxID=231048 RepID=UPI0031B5F3C3